MNNMVQAQRGPKVGDLTNTLEVVKLCSNDEHPSFFYLNKDVACQSKLLKEQVKTAPLEEGSRTRVVHLLLPATTLETVVKYLHYRVINSRLSQADRAQFDIEPKEALNILKAGIYLQC